MTSKPCLMEKSTADTAEYQSVLTHATKAQLAHLADELLSGESRARWDRSGRNGRIHFLAQKASNSGTSITILTDRLRTQPLSTCTRSAETACTTRTLPESEYNRMRTTKL